MGESIINHAVTYLSMWFNIIISNPSLTMLTQTNGSSNEAINEKNIKQAYQIIKHKAIWFNNEEMSYSHYSITHGRDIILGIQNLLEYEFMGLMDIYVIVHISF